jgi:serine/threonine-protein kinase
MALVSPEKDTVARSIGRYVLFREVGHGGMATVHLGRLRGPAGFARTVAIKRLHPQFARDPEFVTMFLDEARLAARIQHPNVVSVLDVVASEGELFLVMDYVQGESLAKLLSIGKSEKRAPPTYRVVLPIVTSLLYGLHAAHEARNERGDPLGIVHRDVTPQNVLVGVDGLARVLDFGIAKASLHAHVATRDGQLKGKIPYMAPEQIGGTTVDRRADVYSASVILWEALAGERLFKAADAITLATAVVSQKHDRPSTRRPEIPRELDAIVMKGLERDPNDRYATAREMAVALAAIAPQATPPEIGEWVVSLAAPSLAARAKSIAEIEGAVLPAMRQSDPPRPMLPPDLRESVRAIKAARASHAEATTLAPPAALSPAIAIGSESPETAAGVPSRATKKRVLLALGVGGVAVLAVSIGTCALGRSSATQGPPMASGSSRASAAMSTALVVIPPPPPLVETPPTPSTSAPPSPSPAAAPSSPPPRPAAQKPNCNPPFTVDRNGVRIPKRFCF